MCRQPCPCVDGRAAGRDLASLFRPPRSTREPRVVGGRVRSKGACRRRVRRRARALRMSHRHRRWRRCCTPACANACGRSRRRAHERKRAASASSRRRASARERLRRLAREEAAASGGACHRPRRRGQNARWPRPPLAWLLKAPRGVRASCARMPTLGYFRHSFSFSFSI